MSSTSNKFIARMMRLGGLVVLSAVSLNWDTLAADSPAAQFPHFDRILPLETTADTSANMSAGDVNGDGNLDLVIAKGRHWPAVSRVLLGDGRGRFSTGYDLSEIAYRSYSARLIDIDGDGALDVVLSNDAPDSKLIYLNDGKGHFRAGSSYGRPAWKTRNVTIADLNGDRLPDIIVANRTDEGANYICLNKGKGLFDADCAAFSNESATTITAADFNHDGLIDLAVPHRDGGQSYVYLAGPNAKYSNLTRIAFGPPDATIRIAEAADFDSDGLLDIVAIDERRGIAIYFARKDGTFSSGVAIDNGKATPYALAARDLNKDGKTDFVVGNVEASSTVYFNDGSGHHYIPIPFGDNKGVTYGFAIADLDGDGLLDIAVARSGAANVVAFAQSRAAKAPSSSAR